jgi:hypothetical protein
VERGDRGFVVVVVCVCGGGGYNPRLGVMKELHPDFIATCAGEPPPPLLLLQGVGGVEKGNLWSVGVCVYGGGGVQPEAGSDKGATPRLRHTCAREPPPLLLLLQGVGGGDWRGRVVVGLCGGGGGGEYNLRLDVMKELPPRLHRHMRR